MKTVPINMSFCVFFVILTLFLSSCATTPRETSGPGDTYAEGVRLMGVGNFLDARIKLEFVKNKFPYSSFATESELALADLSFRENNQIQAAAEYEVFIELHPKHPKSDYVLSQIAHAYCEQVPYFEGRDQNPTHKALNAYDRLIQSFPQSSYIEEAQKKRKELQNILVLKELHIADYYSKVSLNYPAAIRYQHLIQLFPNYDHLDTVYYKWVKSLVKAEKTDLAERAKSEFVAKFPQSQWLSKLDLAVASQEQ